MRKKPSPVRARLRSADSKRAITVLERESSVVKPTFTQVWGIRV